MSRREVRILGPGDEPLLERFLSRHAATSMFLRSNARAAGLVDRGERLQATYAAAVRDGEAVAVAAHAWNGLVLLQAESSELPDVVRAATQRSRRAVSGFAGPYAQVVAARALVGEPRSPPTFDSCEDLFELELARLAVPALLDQPGHRVRRAAPPDLDELTEWRHDYMVEALHAKPGEGLRTAARDEMRRMIAEGVGFVLDAEGACAAFSAFNARLPDVVQVGGVFTPPGRRGRGYARAVVAASLLDAQREGASRAVLFTDRLNIAARRAYVALGFEPIGEYGLLMF